VEIRILGPIEANFQGHPVPLARRQLRVVLGILALEANNHVPRDRLIDLLWGDTPPSRATAILQSRISELRAAITGTDPGIVLDSNEHGYLLRVPAHQVDWHRFTGLVADARASTDSTRRRDLLACALHLWRGPAFGGPDPDAPHHQLLPALDDARLDATEDFYDVQLQLGQHSAIIAELQESATANPQRERLQCLLMQALQRCGRAAEAVQEYDRWRRWLRDELGLEPGQQARDSYLAMIRDDVTPSRPDSPRADAPRTLPPAVPDFAGRADQVRDLRKALAPTTSTAGAIVLTGPGGVGKTALAIRVAHDLTDDFPDGQLYVNLRGFADADPRQPADVLLEFLRLLGVDRSAVPDGLDERVSLYRGLIADRTMLVILDNACEDSQVIPLLPNGQHSRALITSRLRLGATFGATTVAVDVLDEAGSIDLLARVAGPERVRSQPDAARQLVASCGHLPLAIRVSGAKLAAKPHWSVAKMVTLLNESRRALDHLSHGHLDVRASIALSYADLDPQAQLLLRQISSIDVTDVGIDLAAAFLGTSRDEAESALERIFDAQLLDASSGTNADPRYRIHDLVRLFGREQLVGDSVDAVLKWRRQAVVAYVLHGYAAHRGLYGGDFMIIRSGVVDGAPGIVPSRIDQPLRWFDRERRTIVELVRWAAQDNLVEACWDLACTTSQLFSTRREFDAWGLILDWAYSVAKRAGDVRGLAAVSCRRGMLDLDCWNSASAHQEYLSAIKLLKGAADLGALGIAHVHLASYLRLSGQGDAAMECYREALVGLDLMDMRVTAAYALRCMAQIYLDREEYGKAEEHFSRALGLFDVAVDGYRSCQAQTLFWQAVMRMRQNRLVEAEALLCLVYEISTNVEEVAGQATALRGLGVLYHRQGEIQRASDIFEMALDLVRMPTPNIVQETILQAMNDLGIASPGC